MTRRTPALTLPANATRRFSCVLAAVAGAAIAPREQRALAALLGIAGAVGAAYLTFSLRIRAMNRFGQKPTGLVEDILVFGATKLIMKGATRPPAPLLPGA